MSFQTFLSGVGVSAVTLITGMVATPWLLRWVGSENYGAYRVILDWMGYIALFELGLAESLVPLLSRAVTRGDTTEVENKIASGVYAYLRILPLQIKGGVALTAAISHLIPLNNGQTENLRWACGIAVLSTLLCPIIPFRIVLEARQLGFLVNALLALQAIVNTATALVLAHRGFGIIGQVVALFIASLVFQIGVCLYARKHYHGLWSTIFRYRGHSRMNSMIRKLRGPYVIFNICGLLGILSQNIIISAILGAKRVSPFFFTQKLIAVVQAQLYGMGSSTWAALNELRTQGEQEVFKSRFIELSQLLITLGLILLGPIAAYNRHFMILWIGRDEYAGNLVTLLAIANALLLSLQAFWGWIFSSTGKAGALAPQYIAFTIISLISGIAFTYLFGICGPPLGTLLAILTTSIWMIPMLIQKHFDISAYSIFVSVARPLVLLCPFIFVLCKFSSHRLSMGWIGLIAEMSCSGLILVSIAWVGVLKATDRHLWKYRIKNVLFTRQKSAT